MGAMMTHEPFNAAAACLMPLGAQNYMDPGRAISPPMRRMDSPDLAQQCGISRPAQAIRPIAPCVIPGRRDPQHVAHEANGQTIALIFDETEFHLGASEKMRSVFLESRAPCAAAHTRAATEHSPRPVPPRPAGSPLGGFRAAVIPQSCSPSHRARIAGSNARSQAPGQSGLMAARCSPAIQQPPV